MADRTLKLTATFNDAGALTGLKVLNAELGQTDNAAKKTKPSMTDLASTWAGLTVAAYGLAKGAKVAYQAVSEGAQLELAEERFDNLTASIGSTSDAILTQLNAATGGMMSNAEMISEEMEGEGLIYISSAMKI